MRAIYFIISILQMRKLKHRQFKETAQGFIVSTWQSQRSGPGTKVPKSVPWLMLDCPTKLSFSVWPVVSSMHIFNVVFLRMSLGRLTRAPFLFFPEFNLSTDFDHTFYQHQHNQVLNNKTCCRLCSLTVSHGLRNVMFHLVIVFNSSTMDEISDLSIVQKEEKQIPTAGKGRLTCRVTSAPFLGNPSFNL